MTDLPLLAVLGYAACGTATETLPAPRRTAFPERASRGGRLPAGAVALARQALAGIERPAETAVLVGTAFGSITETEAFVDNMLREREAAPKPRAFSLSVHNAAASRIAIELGAHGECHTFTHGELSFAQAVLSARFAAARAPAATLVVSGLDEGESLVHTHLLRDVPARSSADGGACLVCRAAPAANALAELVSVTLERPAEPEAWVQDRLPAAEADAVLWVPPLTGPAAAPATLPPRTIAVAASHGSACATATAIAVGLLAGEVDARAWGLPARPRRLAIVAASRLRDLGLLVLRGVAAVP